MSSLSSLKSDLAAAREELVAAAGRIAPEERASCLVCGVWTLKDVLGHIADWEWLGVEGLRDMAAGRSPQVEHVADIDAWNQVHADARREQSWEEVWADFHAARKAFLEVLDGMSEADLDQRVFAFPWGAEGTPRRWVRVYVDHDREHARGMAGR
jgi:uncharacterized damage-inducible protein DinB